MRFVYFQVGRFSSLSTRFMNSLPSRIKKDNSKPTANIDGVPGAFVHQGNIKNLQVTIKNYNYPSEQSNCRNQRHPEKNQSYEENMEKIKETLQLKEDELLTFRKTFDQSGNALEGKQIEIDAMEQMNRQLQVTVTQLQDQLKTQTDDEGKQVSSATEEQNVVTEDSQEGWGAEADEVLVQTSSNDESTAETVLQLEEEISELRHKLRSSEEDKASLKEELNLAKLKHGKLTLKVKTLSKELDSLRGKKGKSSSPEDNLLDMAIQDELKEQVTKAEKEAKELKKQVKDLKEMENSFTLLKARSEELENVLTSTRQEREELSGKVIELQLQIDALIEEQDILKNVDICNKQLQEECESLKLRLDSSQSEKALSSGKEVSLDAIAAETVIPDPCDNKEKSRMQEEYAHFQETNQHLQAEIESLKNCIEEQSTSNEELQKQLEIFHQFGAQKFSTDSMNADQLQAAVNFERGLVANLQRDITGRDDRIKMLEQQLGTYNSVCFYALNFVRWA